MSNPTVTPEPVLRNWNVHPLSADTHPHILHGTHKEYPRVVLEIYPDLGCWFIEITAHPYGGRKCTLFLTPCADSGLAMRFADLFPTIDIWPTLVSSDNWSLADGRHLLK